MKRLYYSPRVYAYIRSSTQDGKIYDVSDDVVSGSVTRNIGQVSTAEIVLRNKFKKWLRDPKDNKSIFLPMDMITIWLQRIGGKPIQVFTGYLDSVPYYQAYPDNVTLTATCTLKKIALTWFDPGLNFFQNVAKDSGFIIDPTTGEALGDSAILGGIGGKTVNDTGFGKMLYEFMVQICNWNSNNVYISNLPPTLPKVATALYKKINTTTQQDLNSLEQVMKQVMGVSAQGSGSNTGVIPNNIQTITGQMKKKADQYNVSLLVLITAAQVLTGFDPTYHQTHIQNSSNWGYGIFAARPPLTQAGEGDKISGHTIKDLMDVSLATELFSRKLVAQGKSLLQSANGGNATSVQKIIHQASGMTIPAGSFASAFATAKQWTNTFNTTNTTNNSTHPTNNTTLAIKKLTWDEPDIVNLMNAREKKIFASDYKGKIFDELAPYYYYMKKNIGGIEITKRTNVTFDSSSLLLSVNTSSAPGGITPIDRAFGLLKGKKSPDYVIVRGSGSPSVQALHNGSAISVSGNRTIGQIADTMPSTSILIQVPKGAAYPNWDGQKLTPTPGTANTAEPTSQSSVANDGLTFQQAASLSLDAAFTGQLAFPVNYIESQFLTGEKALMNDVSCLDAVEQLCASCKRTFMSLPNGKFLAFYPDYFGAHGRQPYWNIHDIEMLDMGIQLSDEQLATHVYVVGDTFSFGNPDLEAFNFVNSRGVATLTMAEILDGLIVAQKGPKESSWGRLKDAYAFLNHYGARPLTLQEPLIRNTYYEFLYAWQKFEQQWAATFNTQVTFTFQPEVMAGGIVGFPQHNLQVFIESVTHSWDYASGFETTAQISSPAAIKDNGLGVAALPGFALAGGVNSVGL